MRFLKLTGKSKIFFLNENKKLPHFTDSILGICFALFVRALATQSL